MNEGQGTPPHVHSPTASGMADRIRRGKEANAATSAAKARGTTRGGLGGPPQPVPPPPSVSTPAQPGQVPLQAPPGQPQPPQQPGMPPGVGSAYPEAQAVSFGTVPVPPPAPAQAGPLRPETIAGVQAFEEVQRQHATQQPGQPQQQVQVPVPPAPPENETREEEPKPRPQLAALFDGLEGDDPFGIRELMMGDARREIIESRLDTLDFDSWIQHLELRQRVPIIQGRFEPMFRTVSGREDLFVKELIGHEVGGHRYVLDKFAVMNLALGLVDINGTIQYPSHIDQKTREPDEKLFEQKLADILRLPVQMLADLAVNYMWFDHRARKLLTLDTVKNG